MNYDYPVPEGVLNGPYKWIFKPKWQLMQLSNAGNNLGVTVGGNGTGKTWQQLYEAERLSYNRHGDPVLFRPEYLWEHLAWGAKDLAILVDALMHKSKARTRGYQIIIDEGQLALFSKDAMKEEVKNLSKTLMTIRSRRWGVQINLPSFGMLTKDVRTITNSLVVMRGVPTKYSFGSYYYVKASSFGDDIFLQKPKFYKIVQTTSGIPAIDMQVSGTLTWPKPSRKCIRIYEHLKEEHQKALYAGLKESTIEKLKTSKDLIAERDRQVFDQASILVESPEKFRTKTGRFMISRVKEYLGVSKSSALNVISKAEELMRENFNVDTYVMKREIVKMDKVSRGVGESIQSRQQAKRIWSETPITQEATA